MRLCKKGIIGVRVKTAGSEGINGVRVKTGFLSDPKGAIHSA
jgi:hypothetical protein